jgi:hypothetical protein
VQSSRAAVASQDSRIERLTAGEAGKRRSFVKSLRTEWRLTSSETRWHVTALNEHIPVAGNYQAATTIGTKKSAVKG